MRDNQQQWQLADQYINDVLNAGETCFINNIVLCELVWVLRTAYKLRREDIITTLETILRTNIFEFDDKAAVWWAVHQMKKGKADFSDYLISKLNQQAGCSETGSFDAKLGNDEGIRLL